MKRDKMKEDDHLNKMIEDWKKKKRCVGVCYLVKVKMMKDKKFRREADNWSQTSHERETNIETSNDDQTKDEKESRLDITTSTSKPLFSQKLWNSYIKKTKKNLGEKEIAYLQT